MSETQCEDKSEARPLPRPEETEPPNTWFACWLFSPGFSPGQA